MAARQPQPRASNADGSAAPTMPPTCEARGARTAKRCACGGDRRTPRARLFRTRGRVVLPDQADALSLSLSLSVSLGWAHALARRPPPEGRAAFGRAEQRAERLLAQRERGALAGAVDEPERRQHEQVRRRPREGE
eukprot:2908349-Prymnesium_polylepis.1